MQKSHNAVDVPPRGPPIRASVAEKCCRECTDAATTRALNFSLFADLFSAFSFSGKYT
jgi:hypothetical protein